MQLTGTDTRHMLPYLSYFFNNYCIPKRVLLICPLLFIPGLTCLAKQPADRFYACLRVILFYSSGCLAPEFFRTSTPSSVFASSIIVSSAKFFIFSYSSFLLTNAS